MTKSIVHLWQNLGFCSDHLHPTPDAITRCFILREKSEVALFSSLENSYRKSNSFLSGKAMRATLKFQELNSASREAQVRSLCAAVHAPCHYQLGARLPVIPPRFLYLQNLFLLGTSVDPTSTEKERQFGQCFTWQTLLIAFWLQWKKGGRHGDPSLT